VCRGTNANETQALRIAMVVPLGDGQVCKLEGEDLSVDQHARGQAVRERRQAAADSFFAHRRTFDAALETLILRNRRAVRQLPAGDELTPLRLGRRIEQSARRAPGRLEYARAGAKYVHK
jgi:hypothetical protein